MYLFLGIYVTTLSYFLWSFVKKQSPLIFGGYYEAHGLACCGNCSVDVQYEPLWGGTKAQCIQRSNAITLEATKILTDVWNENFESGLPQGQNIFDEKTERMWTSIWLFYANSTRFASAMAGGGDYGVFANGRYQTTEQLTHLLEQLKLYQSFQAAE